jgi:outer membrane immunogenic protein
MMNSRLTYAAAPSQLRRTSARKGAWAFGIAALFAAASADAFAADVPVRGPAPVPPYATPSPVPPYMTQNPCYNCNYYYNWTGFYVGGNVGGAWDRTTLTDNFFNVNVSDSRTGFVAGAQIGYNWQISRQFVIGVELMLDGTDIKTETTTVVPPTVITASAKVDWITILAARFGWAANNWLFYGKAGGAWVHDSVTVTASRPGMGPFSASASDTTGGWLVGAGIEYGFAPNWTARIEWDHIGLDDVNHSGFVTLFAPDAITISRRLDLLTVGLNYRF